MNVSYTWIHCFSRCGFWIFFNRPFVCQQKQTQPRSTTISKNKLSQMAPKPAPGCGASERGRMALAAPGGGSCPRRSPAQPSPVPPSFTSELCPAWPMLGFVFGLRDASGSGWAVGAHLALPSCALAEPSRVASPFPSCSPSSLPWLATHQPLPHCSCRRWQLGPSGSCLCEPKSLRKGKQEHAVTEVKRAIHHALGSHSQPCSSPLGAHVVLNTSWRGTGPFSLLQAFCVPVPSFLRWQGTTLEQRLLSFFCSSASPSL